MVLQRISMAVVAVVAAGLFMSAVSDDTPVGSPVPPAAGSAPSPTAPREIAGVYPQEGSRVCPLPRISVELHVTDGMRSGGTFNPSTVTLTVDGVDVTSQARVVGTLTYPQSRVSLVYLPSTPLATGTHWTAIAYPAANGRRTTFRWTFAVADIPCP